MKHIRQGPHECFPTTIAILAGVTTDEVIEVARRAHPWEGPWSEISSEWHRFCPRIRAILDYYLPDYTQRIVALHFSSVVAGTGKPLDISGKGVIIVRGLNGSGHMISYEKGLIYDSTWTSPETLEEWYKRVMHTVRSYDRLELGEGTRDEHETWRQDSPGRAGS